MCLIKDAFFGEKNFDEYVFLNFKLIGAIQV